MKRTIAGGTGADARYIKKGVDSTESIETGLHSLLNCRFIPNVCDREAGFAQFGGKGTALTLIPSDHENLAVRRPAARRGGRYPRRPG